MELVVARVIASLWVGMFTIWFITGIRLKPTARSTSETQAHVSVWIVWLGWFLLFSQHPGSPNVQLMPRTPATGYIGLLLTAIGLLFAIWARLAIGRNWSGMVTVTEGHELVRTGPYSIVRHPIYSGLMLGTLGTAIAYGGAAGFLGFACVALSWGYKSRVEEKLMVEQFGEQYEKYRRQVKALVPLVW